MAKKRRRPETLEEYLNIKRSMTTGKTDYLASRYQKSLKKALGLRDDATSELDFLERHNVSIGKYSLRTWIKKNPWLQHGRPATQAIKWLFREVFRNPNKYRYRQRAMHSGGLFIFEYKNPKFKDTPKLPWFDKYPLVLSLGPKVTNEGIRNIGFNLHLLPPKIRIVVLVKIFELHKRLYRYRIFMRNDKPVQLNYELIKKVLKPYGVLFSIRMYIPYRQRSVVHFPYRDWYKAVFIPSRGYDGIRAQKLIKEWNKYVRGLGFATSARLDWKSKI